MPERPYSRDGVPLYEFAPPLTGSPWEPCGQLDLGSSSKLPPALTSHSPADLPESTTDGEVPVSDATVFSAKTMFESTLDSFTAYSGEAFFPVLHDSGASLTLHPRSYREMLLKKGVQPQLVGERRVSTKGFTGSPVIGTVKIYEFPLQL